MTVRELSERITSYEMTEWLAYFDLQRNPPTKQQTAKEARTVLSSMAVKKKRKDHV